MFFDRGCDKSTLTFPFTHVLTPSDIAKKKPHKKNMPTDNCTLGNTNNTCQNVHHLYA